MKWRFPRLSSALRSDLRLARGPPNKKPWNILWVGVALFWVVRFSLLKLSAWGKKKTHKLWTHKLFESRDNPGTTPPVNQREKLMFPVFRGENINFLARWTLGQPAICPRAIWTLTRAKSLCLCAFLLPQYRVLFLVGLPRKQKIGVKQSFGPNIWVSNRQRARSLRTRPHKRVTLIMVGFSRLKQPPSRSSTWGDELILVEKDMSGEEMYYQNSRQSRFSGV